MRTLAIKKTEKSLAELLIIVVIVGSLMAVFIHYFLKQAPNFNATGFDGLKANFSSKVRIIHSQWLMDKQPNWVMVTSTESKAQANGKRIKTPVNKRGWVDVKDTDARCEKIWWYVMDIPLMLLQSPIVAVEIQNKQQLNTRACRYSLHSGQSFEYNTFSGNVIKINQ